MDTTKITDEIGKLIEQQKDDDAYEALRRLFFSKPLINTEGDDKELAQVCNHVGFNILHARREWQREVDWWDRVIKVINEYERENSVKLHKGLPYHNRALPLLELAKPRLAMESVEIALQEDVRNFGENEALNRPAYKVGCFLVPIVRLGAWSENDPVMTEEEKRTLISSFESLFQAAHNLGYSYSGNTLRIVPDEKLRNALLRRYQSIEQGVKNDDPLLVTIYSGSIIEGILTFLLNQKVSLAITNYREIATSEPEFVYPIVSLSGESTARLIEYFAPLDKDEQTRKNRLEKWSFNQKIKVGLKIGLFGGSSNPTMSILCHLLRNYRNLIHPTYGDMLGSKQNWDFSFEVNTQIARMLKKALDIVLSSIQAKIVVLQTTSTKTYPAYSSLASPGLPGRFDDQGRFIRGQVQTQSQTSSGPTNPAMGSSTTTTTTG